MLALSTLCLVALSAALRSPHLRIPSSVQPQRARLVASADQSIDHTALLAECNGDASTLAKLLSKEQLKKMCAERKLRVSGTKSDLAPRLLAALVEDQPQGVPPAPIAPTKAAAPPAHSQEAAAVGARAGSSSPSRPAPRPSHLPAKAASGAGARVAAGQPASHLASVAQPLASTSTGCDWELTVLGSGSCNPSPWRGASCSALRVRDSIWLFDVGEGTQVQLQRCMIKPAKIDRIFITHAHGDHCFGLPGLLCLISRGRGQGAPPVEIYGPAGLRAFVRTAVMFTRTRMLPPYVVHELHEMPPPKQATLRAMRGGAAQPGAPQAAAGHSADRQTGGDVRRWGGTTRDGYQWGEVAGGRDLLPRDHLNWWQLLRFEDVTVSAAPVQHTVTCVGFIVTEDSRPGRLQPELALPKLLANRQAIKDEWGVRDPRALLKKVKELGREEEMRLPDGTTILGREVLGEPRRGRKVVLLGDCCDASLCAHLAQGADLLVHEATNAYLPTYGDTGGGEALERTTIAHGHSTPQMAGRTAARFGARALLLTHFSQRYHPAQRGVMRAIKKLALGSSSLPDDSVATAHDALTVPVWQPDRAKPMLSLDEHEAPPTGAEASSDVQAAVAYASSLDFGR